MNVIINALKNINFKEISQKLTSKTVIGSVLFAISLWIYTSLNDEYITNVRIPLKVELPENRAPERQPPENLTVKVQGTGWQLFNLSVFNSAKECRLTLDESKFNLDSINVTRIELLNSMLGMVNVEPKDVYPEQVSIYTGLIGEKYVKIKLMVNIETKQGFRRVGGLSFKPDSILIRGNKKLIKDINYWPTEELSFKNLYESFEYEVELKDSLAEIVELSESVVLISGEIQQEAEITIPDVNISVRGTKPRINYTINPQRIEITLVGGIKQIENVNPGKISAFVNSYSIVNDTTGIIIPNIVYPDSLELFRIKPSYLYLYKEG